MGRLAILGGAGQLPVMLQQRYPDAVAVGFQGMQTEMSDPRIVAFEKLGGLFEMLASEGVDHVCMVGGLSRPNLNPSDFDAGMREIAPRLMGAMAGGDDGLLREIIAIFEERGFETRGIHVLLPELIADEGVLTSCAPSDQDISDIDRADMILDALAPVDVGQAAVVAGGLCLGIETIQGTDALLYLVKATPEKLRRAPGVLVKRPKKGQDLRVDMPTIGPATVQNAADAGVSGLAISPGQVLLVEKPKMIELANKLGLFIVAREPA